MMNFKFCYVLASPFYIGSYDEDDLILGNETPPQQIDLSYNYWLGHFPVTVAQFTDFVQTTGYEPRDAKSLIGKANCPVKRATWLDAIHFCQWLNEQWQQQNILSTDWQITLPSESEWEKGARGGLDIPLTPLVQSIESIENWQPDIVLQPNDMPKRRFPWGEVSDPNKANYDESGFDAATISGQFSDGVSPYGCEDMSGNVWEWTRSKYKEYPYILTNGRENVDMDRGIQRVLRGGSYNSYARSIRCTTRLYRRARAKLTSSGFRLVIKPIT